MTGLSSWLEPRLEDAPATLRDRIIRAVADRTADGRTGGRADGSSLYDQFAAVAEELMREAKSAPATRDTAMTLHAADALITFACEAAAETEPSQLSELR